METAIVREHSLPKQKKRLFLALFALSLVAFTIGTTEFVILGLLPDVAQDLNVSLSDAGLLVSGYALGIVIGAPGITVLTRRIPRKTLLLWLTGIFIVGVVLSALSYDYSLLMIARIIAALCQGAITGIAVVVVSQLAPPDKQGSALAMVMVGSVLANVAGVPIGTYLGQWMGWQFPFWVIAFLAVVSFVSVAMWVPRVSNSHNLGLFAEFSVLIRPRVVLILIMTVFSFGSVFAVFTFIVPLLQQVSGFSPSQTSLMLVLFGIGTIFGGVVGGKVADRALLPSLMMFQVGLIIVFLVFFVTFQYQLFAIIGLFLFGFTAFGIAPGLQVLILREATDARGLASSFNIAAFNLGAAGGSFLGSMTVDSSVGTTFLFVVGAVTAFIGLLVAISLFLSKKKQESITTQV
ncbi:MFS transporter [Paenibacillus sp. L3-i20]|uniref:MFS transporter n=1 Tax=Paenibacillus sp. L3-i20 TaxID=2905833 RepID=UPI001EE126B2|nr:MFS transporter [Paenibacillus sp. L3-i20]GKU76589.1 MFS transporter [Paenibacillus sp. L3-i20]